MNIPLIIKNKPIIISNEILWSYNPKFDNWLIIKLRILLLIINFPSLRVPNTSGMRIMLVLSAKPAIAIRKNEKYNLYPR